MNKNQIDWEKAKDICGCAIEDCPASGGLIEKLQWVREHNMGEGTDGEINADELDAFIARLALAPESDSDPDEEEKALKYAIATDSVSTVVQAGSVDEAARLFAESEGINGVATAAELVRHFESRDGWCRINFATEVA